MKILHSFNTWIHKEVFIQCLQQFWEKNIVSFRRHIFYLIPAFWYWIISLLGFFLVNGSIYFQFQVYQNIYYTYIGLAFIIYTLWSISFFVSNIRVIFSESPIAYSLEHINNLSNKFHFFIKLSIILFVIRILMLFIGIFLEFYLPHPERLLGIPSFIFHILSCVIYLLWVYFVVYRVIMYSMSYCTLTPQSLEIIEQRWFFEKKSTVIQLKRLTLISVMSTGFFQSLFRFGNVHFQTDGSISWEDTSMSISYAPKPNLLKDILHNILSLKSSK